jgi:nicotinate-nucleotide adenylyltransferase
MRPAQLWLDLSQSQLNIWYDSTLEMVHQKNHTSQRIGFFKDVAIFMLTPERAKDLNWISFPWEEVWQKTGLDELFFLELQAARFPYFFEKNERADLQAPLLFSPSLESDILFFGGTFHPFHQGHEACLKLAPKNLPVLVCPDVNPHKKSTPLLKQELRALSSQLRLLQLNKLHYNPLFALKGIQNPTYFWMKRLKFYRPDLKCHLLLGFDSFYHFHTWTEAQKLAELIEGFWIVPRGESEEEFVQAVGHATNFGMSERLHFLGHHPYEHISSTLLRKNQKS